MKNTTKEKVKKILNVVLDIFLVVFVLLSALVLILSLTQKNGNVSQIFGYTIRSVQTESMEKYDGNGDLVEDGIKKGDMVICEVLDDDDDRDFEVGDVVMFSMPVIAYSDGTHHECEPGQSADLDIFVIHSIIEVIDTNGIIQYRTQGINNPIPDINLKSPSDIIAEYDGVRIGGLGTVVDFLQSQTGMFVCIILPLLLFVLFQGYRVVKNLIIYNREKALLEAEEARTGELSDEEKRRIAEEYLKSQGIISTEKNGTETTTESPVTTESNDRTEE